MDVDLCNATLTALGLPPLADPQKPRGAVEEAVVRMSDTARDEVLEANMWSHANKVAKLEPEDGGLVPAGFSHVAVLPPDFLGLWNARADKYTLVIVGEGEAARRRLAWAGDAAVVITYSASIPYTLMNPLLRAVCVDKLAAKAAMVKTEKATERKIHHDIALDSEAKAASRDALNRKDEPLFHSRWDPANVSAGDDPHLRPRGNW